MISSPHYLLGLLAHKQFQYHLFLQDLLLLKQYPLLIYHQDLLDHKQYQLEFSSTIQFRQINKVRPPYSNKHIFSRDKRFTHHSTNINLWEPRTRKMKHCSLSILFIREVLHKHHIKPSKIYSIKLLFSNQGKTKLKSIILKHNNVYNKAHRKVNHIKGSNSTYKFSNHRPQLFKFLVKCKLDSKLHIIITNIKFRIITTKHKAIRLIKLTSSCNNRIFNSHKHSSKLL